MDIAIGIVVGIFIGALGALVYLYVEGSFRKIARVAVNSSVPHHLPFLSTFPSSHGAEQFTSALASAGYPAISRPPVAGVWAVAWSVVVAPEAALLRRFQREFTWLSAKAGGKFVGAEIILTKESFSEKAA